MPDLASAVDGEEAGPCPKNCPIVGTGSMNDRQKKTPCTDKIKI